MKKDKTEFENGKTVLISTCKIDSLNGKTFKTKIQPQRKNRNGEIDKTERRNRQNGNKENVKKTTKTAKIARQIKTVYTAKR